MYINHVKTKFEAMGARLVVHLSTRESGYTIGIRRDQDGDYFNLRMSKIALNTLDITVLSIEPKNRHLLLLVRNITKKPKNDRYLCGHDERDWFVAAVPGGASTVSQAMDELQPVEVRKALIQHKAPTHKRHSRKNKVFCRQGEWFFMPEPSLQVDSKLVLNNEPLRRGRSRPHMAEQIYREGGETVYVLSSHPNGVDEKRYREIIQEKPEAARWGWKIMRRNPEVYVCGAVRHPDHATIVLPFWHRVFMNTENKAGTLDEMAFLD